MGWIYTQYQGETFSLKVATISTLFQNILEQLSLKQMTQIICVGWETIFKRLFLYLY